MSNEIALCQLCGEPMPEGEEVFNYHGYSGNCPKVEKHELDPMKCPCMYWARTAGTLHDSGHHPKCDGTGHHRSFTARPDEEKGLTVKQRFQKQIRELRSERDDLRLQVKGLEGFACPCTVADEPCDKDCTCLNGLSSRGCYCCARYGSLEQRKAVANHLVKIAQADRHTAYQIRPLTHKDQN